MDTTGGNNAIMTAPEISDESLMLCYAQQGDMASFKMLYHRYRVSLYRYLLRQIGNEATTEELFQDIWTNVIRHRDNYQRLASFRTYLYTLARHRLIDYGRRQQANPIDSTANIAEHEPSDRHDTPEIAWQKNINYQNVLDALQQLPEAQRDVFLLKEEAQLSIVDIAKITGEKPEAIKSRYRYALQRLRTALEALV